MSFYLCLILISPFVGIYMASLYCERNEGIEEKPVVFIIGGAAAIFVAMIPYPFIY